MKAERSAGSMSRQSPKSRASLIVRAVALGIPGIAAVVLLVPPPEGVPTIALAINPAILLCAAAFAGSFAAPKVGLRSAVLSGDAISLRSLLLSFGLGVALGLGLAGLDCATAPLWQSPGSSLPALCEPAGPASLAMGIFYGGVTEELIMRWGVLSILALGLSRLMPIKWSLGFAVILSAALFALAHLPAVWMAASDPTTAALFRTLALNAVAGIVFGVLYLRSGLEAAMLSHIGFHCAAFASGFFVGPSV